MRIGVLVCVGGSQYTHGGYVGFDKPPCRGKGPGPCTIESGIQAQPQAILTTHTPA